MKKSNINKWNNKNEYQRSNLEEKYKKNSSISIYVCGPTVYSSPHIGNLRPIITFDIYKRALKGKRHNVILINNITDIDDKIIEASIQSNLPEKKIAQKFEKEYLRLLIAMNIIKPNQTPKVIKNIDKSIEIIEKLINSDNAYKSDGNVYFDVTTIKGYGQLANRDFKNNQSFNNEYKKKTKEDFALWKRTEEGIKFESPWGMGRPGWHLECATNIFNSLKGESLDIHGGGMDLKFPHHENERAIYKALTRKEIAKEWKHTGQINFNNIKMSKSLGNIILAKTFIDRYDVDLLRYIVLTTGVTSPIDLNENYLEKVSAELSKLSKTFYRAQAHVKKYAKRSKKVNVFLNAIINWNFSYAMFILNKSTKAFNRDKKTQDAIDVVRILQLIGFKFSKETISEDEKSWYNKWNIYRSNKEYDKADALYEKMKKRGLV